MSKLTFIRAQINTLPFTHACFYVSMAEIKNSQIVSSQDSKTASEKILCPYCKRTATNGIRCKGICVADSDY
ncbi:hypothetical protein NIES970_02570 [[Synechococcus] sp. NIES-970]|nr:hypothetical protein NIES970_02570 [[Synechococcus] sp. NIES-970]